MNDLIYMKFSKRQNCSGKEQARGCQVVGVREGYNFQRRFCSDWTFLFLDGGGGYTHHKKKFETFFLACDGY